MNCSLLAVNAKVEILFGFPFVVKQSVGSVVKLEFSYALPSISFPFRGAIGAKIGANAIAAMLRLAISFKLGQIGILSVAFDSAVHGSVANKGTIEENRGISAPL